MGLWHVFLSTVSRNGLVICLLSDSGVHPTNPASRERGLKLLEGCFFFFFCRKRSICHVCLWKLFHGVYWTVNTKTNFYGWNCGNAWQNPTWHKSAFPSRRLTVSANQFFYFFIYHFIPLHSVALIVESPNIAAAHKAAMQGCQLNPVSKGTYELNEHGWLNAAKVLILFKWSPL